MRKEPRWDELVRFAAAENGRAAQSHLAAGRPIYYSKAQTPAGLLIKKHPDGRRQLVRFRTPEDEVIAELSPHTGV